MKAPWIEPTGTNMGLSRRREDDSAADQGCARGSIFSLFWAVWSGARSWPRRLNIFTFFGPFGLEQVHGQGG